MWLGALVLTSWGGQGGLEPGSAGAGSRFTQLETPLLCPLPKVPGAKPRPGSRGRAAPETAHPSTRPCSAPVDLLCFSCHQSM